MTTPNPRSADHPIDPQFVNRWSPRAFSPEPIDNATLLTFLEAARWAPSSYNSQPWRFIYATRDSEHWKQFLGFLNDFNRSWASEAAALVIVLSKSTFVPPGATDEVTSLSHSFDTGAAWGYLALQASLSGWHAHGMAGFDKEKTRSVLGVPANFAIEAAVAIGKIGNKATLPEGLRAKEEPSPRLPLQALVSEGTFKA